MTKPASSYLMAFQVSSATCKINVIVQNYLPVLRSHEGGNTLYCCAAEVVFCYTAENSHHLEAQVTSKNPQFQEEKISERRKARSQVTLEKSSKNYISLFGGKPAVPEGYQYPCHPLPLREQISHIYT
jgi:hypothetical protein